MIINSVELAEKGTSNLSDTLLQQVEIDVDIKCPIAITTIRQSFCNNTEQTIEAVYQFPLPKEASFLSIIIELNGEKFHGEVIEKQSANEQYEEAIAQENTSILIEKIAEGLFQINAGNLAINDELSIEIEVATCLELSPQQARYYLPTVIAPRYGKQSMQDYHEIKTDLLSRYEVKGNLTINDELSLTLSLIKEQSAVCFNQTEQGLKFSTLLDKDLVLNFQLSKQLNSTAWYATKGEDYLGLALIHPHTDLIKAGDCSSDSTSTFANNIQLVVDCSGSMLGAPIEQAKKGLSHLFSLFDEQDQINILKFGSTTEQALTQWQSFDCLSRLLLNHQVTNLSADLGGTEMLTALNQALDNAAHVEQSEIILLTDGEIWLDEQLLKQLTRRAVKLNCRISTLGLGNSVVETVLLQLSQKTGGKCVLVNPCENIAPRIEHLLQYAKAKPLKVSISQLPANVWNEKPSMIRQQTPTLLSLMASSEPTKPLMISCENINDDGVVDNTSQINHQGQQLGWQQVNGKFAQALIGLVVMKRILASTEGTANSLAINFQQITDATSFIMTVHRDQQLGDMPELEQIKQMLPEGWGGIGSSSAAHCMMDSSSSSVSLDNYMDIPAFLLRSADDPKLFGHDPIIYQINQPEYLLNTIQRQCRILTKQLPCSALNQLEPFGLPKPFVKALALLAAYDEQDEFQEYDIICCFILKLSQKFNWKLSFNFKRCLNKGDELPNYMVNRIKDIVSLVESYAWREEALQSLLDEQ